MAKYKVRKGFAVALNIDDRGNTRVYLEGEDIELNDLQAQMHAHQIEPMPSETKNTK